MGRDGEERRRDRRGDRRRQRSRSRSRDRTNRDGGSNRGRHGDGGRRDAHRQDDRRDRDRNFDRGGDRNEGNRPRDRKKQTSPDLPRGNRFFDRARKLGIVTDSSLLAASATATGPNSSSVSRLDSEQPAGSQSPASLAAARALALSASLAQSGSTRTALPTPEASLNAAAGTSVDPNVPAYYNPAIVNTAKIADQIKKRKMLWTRPGSEDTKEAAQASSSDTEKEDPQKSSSTIKYWANATFKGDDGKMTAKFRKLMGMKDAEAAPPPKDSSKVLDQQDQLFKQLDLQYQAARATTHTQRGMGLGWGH